MNNKNQEKKTIKWARCLAAIVLLAFTVMYQGTASAGLLDKLNAATKKLNDYNARQQSGQSNQPSAQTGDSTGEDPDRPLDLYKQKGFKGSCEGKRSATCMDYMEAVDHCMDPLKGYRMKVTSDLIDKKLKNEKLNDQQRKNLETDLVGIKEAYKNKTDNPTINGEKNSQRYLNHISEEDQVYINAEYQIFYKKIYNKCMGADHMGIGKRTEMMQDVETISGDEAVKQMRASRAKEEEPFNCAKKAGFVRWAIMADLMEKRMNERNISGKERADWEADIASLREFADKAEGGMPKAIDPSNPMRAMMRLTDPADQTTVSNETLKKTQEVLDGCTAKNKTGVAKQRKPKSGGLVDHSKSPANPDASRIVEKAGRGNYKSRGGDSLSSHLGATKVDAMVEYSSCSKPGIGHLAQVTADTLEEKLNAAQGISDQKRQEWEEDISTWREAARSGKDRQNPPDPDNPYRWQDYVTNAERSAINKKHADFITKLMKQCADKGKMGSPMGSTIKN
jgi:hypothetical protein